MDFYKINEEYNKFLQKYEKEHRGIIKILNIRYADRNKFAFGTVLIVNNILNSVSKMKSVFRKRLTKFMKSNV